ncbi:MAG: polyphenol oxidase family protein [Candidatus Palauibacterales bacterium]|nr:polyphenol oxidase family protein [Candidatus Palauibacterales bacterium]MDP2530512.1 polyphenol oxidase family protein [Candidatus Palauibacterales bacterium]MDP2582929.1 polyphenol oxidase family protein [Candidatus Palauibacterales bacterium]
MDGDLNPAVRAARANPVTEVRRTGRPAEAPIFRNLAWEKARPGLAAGITGVGPDSDYGLTTAPDPWTLADRVDRLCARLGATAAAMVRQVHGRCVVPLEVAPDRGLLLAGTGDGLVCARPGTLLVVTAADCVPVYLLDPPSGTLGLVHAGWRGAAAGVLEAGVEAMSHLGAAPPERIRVHLGPGICGRCYEVGPDVLQAFGRPASASGHVDIRSELALRARSAGVRPAHLSRSTWCTRCSRDQFHSHRGMGGEAGRMAAFLGWVTPAR